MAIQNPSTGPLHTNPARSDEASQAQEAASSEGKENEPAATEETSASDRVEISDAAREAHSDVGGDAALIERGQQALKESSLSDARLAELQRRVEDGYYTQSEVTQEIAEGLARDLGGSASA